MATVEEQVGDLVRAGRPEQAVRLLDDLLATERRGELLLTRAWVAQSMRDHDERHRFLSAAASWYRERRDSAGEARALAQIAFPLGRALTHAERIAAGERALELARAAADPRLISVCASNFAFAHVYRGSRGALDIFPETVELVEGADPRAAVSVCWNWAAAGFALGDYADVARALARVRPFVDDASRPQIAALDAMLAFRQGRWDEALVHVRSAGDRPPPFASFVVAVETAIEMERLPRFNVTRLGAVVGSLRTALHWLPMAASVLVTARKLLREPNPERGMSEMLGEIALSGRRSGWDELIVAAAEAGGSVAREARTLTERLRPAGPRARASVTMARAIECRGPEAAELFERAAGEYARIGDPYRRGQALARAAVARARARRPAGTLDRQAAQELARVGASRSLAELLRATRGSSATRAFALPESQRYARSPGLTPREWEVAQLASEGFTAADIAAQLGTSVRTVETQLAAVKRKLGVRRKADIVRLGRGRFAWLETT